MKNKYFTPDIEDLCIGYECQFRMDKNSIYWEELLISNKDIIKELINHPEFEFRTIYLTKEQIEAEGWTKEKSYFIKNNIYLFFEDKFLVIDSGNPFSWEAIDSEILFKGKCKDINTFRKICKLLEI